MRRLVGVNLLHIVLLKSKLYCKVFSCLAPNLTLTVYPMGHAIHRGSYMSAHVLLNLLNELGKRDKMRGLPSILSLFRNEFNEFNNTRARMLDSIII